MPIPPGFHDLASFPFIEALLGRRSRRFFAGAEIPDGVFAYKSDKHALPLTEQEKALVVAACGGNTSWHHLIYRAARYAPHLSNYAGAAGGRTFPSAAGFHTSQTFFTDDKGVYLLDMRDATAYQERDLEGSLNLETFAEYVRAHTRKIQDTRLKLPSEVPFTEAHNTWVFNKPSTLVVIPVGDLSQHVMLNLCYMLQNGLVLYDDINKRPIPGMEHYKDMVDVNNVWPLTFVDQWSLSEISIELGTSCYAGTLMLQALGLGGWMLNGADAFSVLGAGSDPAAYGLGFRYDTDEKRWPYPNPTGLKGVMEGYCPPHYPDMRSAVEALCERKFGPGGPFNPRTPGPWKQSGEVRSAAQVHDERFRECVALQARYVYDTFGKFPGTVPSMFTIMYLQAHHLDPDFYDRFYKPGSYLKTHATHMERWH
ncbi:MAG: hypothetical protein GF344_01770 [Chitinivibrionales bacterium]|nr:hypothetical protein [Chitinivibrionales bacterium]MBD3355820.1 hypothetical protein [Chitinivibrionales bacterium]